MIGGEGRKKWLLGIGLLVVMLVTTAAPAVDTADGPSATGDPGPAAGAEPPDSGEPGAGDGADPRDAADPSRGVDTDGDGLSNQAERATTGPLADADPMRRDIFVEIDYRGTDDPEAIREALQPVVTRFEEAPIDNPDGSTGIDLHLVLDERISHSGAISEDDLFIPNGGAVVRKYRDYGESGYHYAAVDLTGQGDRGGSGAFGRMRVSLDSTHYLDHTFMHELGHSLGIVPSTYRGVDTRAVPADTYQSVMNYNYQNGPVQYNDGGPFDDWAFIEDGYTPGRGGGGCESTQFRRIC